MSKRSGHLGLLWFAVFGFVAALPVVWWMDRADTSPIVTWTVEGHATPPTMFSVVPAETPLHMQLQLRRPAHVYVASFDPLRGTIAMFPNSYLRSELPANPLPAGDYTPPGNQGALGLRWHSGDAPGPMSILVVASEQALPKLEAIWSDFRQMGNAAFPGRVKLGTYAPEGGMEQVPSRSEVHTAVLQAALALDDPEANGPMRPWNDHEGVWLKVLRLSGKVPTEIAPVKQQVSDKMRAAEPEPGTRPPR